MPNELGFDIVTGNNFIKDAFLFGEVQGRTVASVTPENQATLESALQNKGVNFTKLGNITTHDCHVDSNLFGGITAAKKHYDAALKQILD